MAPFLFEQFAHTSIISRIMENGMHFFTLSIVWMSESKMNMYKTVYSTHLFNRMECRLVLNNLSTSDISNSSLSGQLQQQLKYYKFRRVPTKAGKSIFYLFFHREEDTYHALQVAKAMKQISVVRYYHRNTTAAPILRPDDMPPSEMQYRSVPPKNIVDAIRYNFSRHIDRFANKV